MLKISRHHQETWLRRCNLLNKTSHDLKPRDYTHFCTFLLYEACPHFWRPKKKKFLRMVLVEQIDTFIIFHYCFLLTWRLYVYPYRNPSFFRMHESMRCSTLISVKTYGPSFGSAYLRWDMKSVSWRSEWAGKVVMHDGGDMPVSFVEAGGVWERRCICIPAGLAPPLTPSMLRLTQSRWLLSRRPWVTACMHLCYGLPRGGLWRGTWRVTF